MSHLPLQDFGLRVQPMVHVACAGARFHVDRRAAGLGEPRRRLGADRLRRDAGCAARPARRGDARRRETVELHFTAAVRLDRSNGHGPTGCIDRERRSTSPRAALR